jgi:serine/threonine protein kinase
MAYAAPEVVQAYCARQLVTVHPAQDVWALGVIVYEAITGAPAFGRMANLDTVYAAAHGQAAYAWEAGARGGTSGGGGGSDGAAAFARSRVREAVLRCLHREPARRPTASQVLKAVDRVGSETQTQTWGTLPPEVAQLINKA